MNWDERSAELEARAQVLFDKCQDGTAPGAVVAMIDLRNMVPDLLEAVSGMRRKHRGELQTRRMVENLNRNVMARERPNPPGDSEQATRRLATAMRAADAFTDETRATLQHGPGQAWILALMALREALEQLPPDPVQ